MPDAGHKVFVMGVDGATFDIILPLVEKGELPNFRKIMDHGAWGDLESVIPPSSGPAWVSFQTGKSPSGHGVFDFVNKKPNSYGTYYINSKSIKGEKLWDILGRHGLKVGIINVMVTYPPYPVNGFLLTGGLTPEGRNFAYPESLADEIESRFGKYRLWGVGGINLTDGGEEKFISSYMSNEKRRMEISKYLIQEKEWDFFMVMLESADPLQHELWRFIDDTHPKHAPDAPEKVREAISDFYRMVDKFLGEIMELLPERTTICIMSDHGFGQLNRYLLANNFLMEIGMLRLRASLVNRIKKLVFDRISLERLYLISRRLGFNRVMKLFRGGASERVLSRVVPSLSDIDWNRTRAFAMGASGHIYINLKGREPEGIVTEGEEYIKVRENIVNELKILVDPLNGQKVIERVYTKEELHRGRFRDQAPDITFLPRRGFCTLHREQFVSPNMFIDSPNCGTHTLQGIMLFHGPEIRAASKIRGSRIFDLAPTILHIMGLPIPEDMDGRVIEDIFESGGDPPKKEESNKNMSPETWRLKQEVGKLRRTGRL